jgi:hypothetical protein
VFWSPYDEQESLQTNEVKIERWRDVQINVPNPWKASRRVHFFCSKLLLLFLVVIVPRAASVSLDPIFSA